MCGIAGIIHFTEAPVEPEALERACVALKHRGPDHAQWWTDKRRRVGLAATRLAVLDPHPRANQPFIDPSGRFVLVFNGELYNFRELRAELHAAGESFDTDGDTEVALAACVRWGMAGLRRFNGMWALAFWDGQLQRGFLSRDPHGIKPLFLARSSGALSFASELDALLPLAAWNRDVNQTALAQLLLYGYIAHPETIYEGARRLAPGEVLTFNDHSSSDPVQYLSPDKVETAEPCAARGDAHSAISYGEACSEVRRALADAVVIRKVSDVPLGAFLSGGLDSSIVCLHLTEALGGPLHTFSVGYAGAGVYDETRFARLVAARLGTQHHELILSERDLFSALPALLDHLSEPFGDSSILPTALLARLARQQVTVALSGDGGDELFGGYWRYLGHEAARAYSRVPRVLRRWLIEPLMGMGGGARTTVSGNRMRQFRKLTRAGDVGPLARHLAWSRILAPEARDLFVDSRASDAVTRDFLARGGAESISEEDALQRILQFDLRMPLPCDMLHKVDLASMMHSLEVRVPFLDSRLVALAGRLPTSFKIDRGVRKRVLIDAYRGRLPDAVLDRAKQGFEVPIGELLRGPLLPMFRDVVSRKAIESFGTINHRVVERMTIEHVGRKFDHSEVLFTLLSLCWWRARIS